MKQKLTHSILPMNYENYIFDLYGTLVDICTKEDEKQVWEKLSMFFGYYQAVYTPEELEEQYHIETAKATKELLAKRATKESKNQVVRKDAHEAFPEIELTAVFQTLYARKNVKADEALAIHTGQVFRLLSTKHLSLYEGTKEMLLDLREHGKKVYLLSNAQRIFTEHEMNELDITKYFDGILLSSDYGVRKPDQRFFALLSEKFGIDYTKSLFIGNDSQTDIAGAITCGMDTFYVNSNISPKDDHAPDANYQVKDFMKWEIEKAL